MRKVTKSYGDQHMQKIAEWTATMLDAAEESAKEIGCSPEAIVAQAALETGWGRSAIGFNIFGIKANGGWTGKKQLVTTREVLNGQSVMMQDWFRDYDNFADSFADHFQFLKENTRYADVFDPNDSMSDAEYFRRLAADGYATDPNYASSLVEMLGSVKSLESHMEKVT